MQNNSFLSNLYRGINKRIQQFFSTKNKKAGLSWFDEKFLKHATPGENRIYHYKRKKIYYSNPSEFLHTFKELFVHEIYKVTLPPQSYIIDCGANIGLSIIYFKELCPTAEILAFEPDDKNFDLLSRNINSFNLQQVTAKKEAVWIADTDISFSSDGTMGSKIETDTKKNTQTVKASRLMNYLDREVNFLKIDIEGAEYTVLKDIKERLSFVKNMFLEYHGSFKQTSELTAMLYWITEKGFSYYIKEAAPIYSTPFLREGREKYAYDIQLNIFCFRTI